jgi:hypothetical protein
MENQTNSSSNNQNPGQNQSTQNSTQDRAYSPDPNKPYQPTEPDQPDVQDPVIDGEEELDQLKEDDNSQGAYAQGSQQNPSSGSSGQGSNQNAGQGIGQSSGQGLGRGSNQGSNQNSGSGPGARENQGGNSSNQDSVNKDKPRNDDQGARFDSDGAQSGAGQSGKGFDSEKPDNSGLGSNSVSGRDLDADESTEAGEEDGTSGS